MRQHPDFFWEMAFLDLNYRLVIGPIHNVNRSFFWVAEEVSILPDVEKDAARFQWYFLLIAYRLKARISDISCVRLFTSVF